MDYLRKSRNGLPIFSFLVLVLLASSKRADAVRDPTTRDTKGGGADASKGACLHPEPDKPDISRAGRLRRQRSLPGGGVRADVDIGGMTLPVVKVRGSPKEMGTQLGVLLRDEIQQHIKEFVPGMIKTLEEALAKKSKVAQELPKWLLDLLLTFGVEKGLDLTVEIMRLKSPTRFIEEMDALAEAAQVDKKHIHWLNAFPELIKAACTIIVSWGDATRNSDAKGGVQQVRALDFAGGPFWKYPALVVYQPIEEGSNEFVSLSWAGFVGSITGMSKDIGVSEKVWLSGREEGTSRLGTPFNFVLRDIMQFARTVDQGVTMAENAERTCSIFVGLGGPSADSDAAGKILLYSHGYLVQYNDTNFAEAFPTATPGNHLVKDGLIYVDKSIQPNDDYCTTARLTKAYGSLDARTLIQEVIAYAGTGDLHAAVYDLENKEIYVSVAGPAVDDASSLGERASNSTNPAPAYSRPFLVFSLDDLYAF